MDLSDILFFFTKYHSLNFYLELPACSFEIYCLFWGKQSAWGIIESLFTKEMLSTKAFRINLLSVTLFPSSHTAPSDSLFPFLLLKPALLVSSFSEINDNEELTCYFIYFYILGEKNKHMCPSNHGFFFICSLLHLYTLLQSPGTGGSYLHRIFSFVN